MFQTRFSVIQIAPEKREKLDEKLKEIIPSKSKDIIDQIDDIFADYFRFTKEEKEFIKEFDIDFRI